MLHKDFYLYVLSKLEFIKAILKALERLNKIKTIKILMEIVVSYLWLANLRLMRSEKINQKDNHMILSQK